MAMTSDEEDKFIKAWKEDKSIPVMEQLADRHQKEKNMAETMKELKEKFYDQFVATPGDGIEYVGILNDDVPLVWQWILDNFQLKESELESKKPEKLPIDVDEAYFRIIARYKEWESSHPIEKPKIEKLEIWDKSHEYPIGLMEDKLNELIDAWNNQSK